MTLADIIDTVEGASPVEDFRKAWRVTALVADWQVNQAREAVAIGYLLPALSGANSEDVDGGELSRACNHLCYAYLLLTSLYVTRVATAKPTKENAVTPSMTDVTDEVRRYRAIGINVLSRICEAAGVDWSAVHTLKLLRDEI